MSIRGIYTYINEIRLKVFTEVAKLSYNYEDGDLSEMELIPYRVVPGEIATYRDSVFLERAVVEERMRLAMGLNLRPVSEHAPVSIGAEECVKPEKYYQPPLINVIKFACHACPDNEMHVTEMCQGCIAHPCQKVCPKDAITFRNGKSVINQEKCVKCGKCATVCPYNAIIKVERPCVKACKVDAISSDEHGRADIDYDKCESCGMCLANCPFGAIADKTQLFQTIQAIRSDTPVYAAIAPACVGQLGSDLSMDKIRSAFKELGFEDAIEVAIGADLCTIQEAEDYIENVPSKLPFMGTSCCPAWASMAKREFPEQADCISMALTPMVLTGRMIKEKHPDCKVAFIGPCAAKKLEASRKSIRSDVDFVLTFEETLGMFLAKDIDIESLETHNTMHGASGDGRAFAISGGVADAVVNVIKDRYPDRDIKVERAEGLDNCKKMLTLAKAGKYDGYLLEGMACPGGCIGGAGTVLPQNKAKAAVLINKKNSSKKHAYESKYEDILPTIAEE